MERGNIRFYEKEGFIKPQRLENGYRTYTDEDLQLLLRVKLFRSLHFSLDEIKLLQGGALNLSASMALHLSKLEREQRDITKAQDVCLAIKNDNAVFSSLDAIKYLNYIKNEVNPADNGYFDIKSDTLPQAFYPFRRLLARILDWSIYNIAWQILTSLLFTINILDRSEVLVVLDFLATALIMLAVEPLLISRFKTTGGKAVLGLKIENGGGRLTYKEAFIRTMTVYRRGLGYFIPLYSLFRLWKSYKACTENETLEWDEGLAYTLKDSRFYRNILYVFSYAVLFFAVYFFALWQLIPPNTGELTVSQYVENVNYYAKYLNIDFGGEYLESDGKWQKKQDYGSVNLDTFYRINPDYIFTLDNTCIKEIGFNIEHENVNELIAPYDSYMVVSSLAYICARGNGALFSKSAEIISAQITGSTFNSFSFTLSEVLVRCDIEISGYEIIDSWFLSPEADSAEKSFCLSFSMKKLN